MVDAEGALQADLPADSFDVVTIVLSIQNISPITPVWQACRALLKPGGSLLVVMMHPCFRVPKQSDWHWSEATHVQSRTVSRYLTSDRIEILTHPGDAAHGVDDSHTLHFHRPLQAYINTLGNAGLYIDHVEEWASHKTDQAGPKKDAIDRARREIPMFLALRAKKV
jgi:SAM-dependent methyltransferase